jgi:hypothetical protein
VLREDFEIRSSEPAGAGIMGALKIAAYYPSIDRTLELKWKAAPSGGDGWNNTPRREIAAYAIQKWFLGPADYIVPPTFARCIALDAYAAIDPEAEPNLEDARCVFGMLATWLDEVEELDPEVDEERFYRDAYYARHLANYNLLTYLIQNRDTRRGNLLVSTDASNPRVFSIDNGITFGVRLYNFFLPQWDVLFVPALPRDSIERLRSVGAEEIRALAAVAEFRRDAGGVLRETRISQVFGAEQGARIQDGVLQLGLEPAEIDGVRDRLAALLADVERGEIDVF